MDYKSKDSFVNPFTSIVRYISIPEHAFKLIRRKWRLIILMSLGIFGVLWTLIESASYFFHADLSGLYLYGALGVISIISAIVQSCFLYLKESPSGLENEPSNIQRIAVIRKPFWEYLLASSLLKEKLAQIDENLKGVLEGQIFVKVTKRPKITEYLEWIQLRPPNLLQMVDIAKRLLIFELPSAIKTTEETESSPKKILKCVERIKDLYQQTCDFEIESRRIQPPGGFEKIHEYQNGWSAVIRNGVKQMIDFLNDFSNANREKVNSPIHFTILFDEPKNIKEFELELKEIEENLPKYIVKEKNRNL